MPSTSDADTVAIFVATSGHSGVDKLIKHLVPAIARRGYPVDVLKIGGHGPHFKEIPTGVRLIKLGTRHVYSSFRALRAYLKDHRPAVMFTDKDRVNRTALLARMNLNISTRMVVSSGTTISVDLASRGPLERWLQRNSMRFLYPFADNIIVTSGGVADDMSEYTGLARQSIQVVPCPVVSEKLFHTDLPRPEHPWYQDGQSPVILGVGELGWRKDFDTLLRAFALLRAQRPTRLIILGRGGQRQRLLSLAAELNISEDVDLPGFVPDPYAYMAHAALLALTSRWEGLGFVLIEALAAGTPVVSTDCPSGPREILDNGRYGHLVPVGDAHQLFRAMDETLNHPLPTETLQKAAWPYEIERSTSAYLQAMGLDPRKP